MVEGEAEVPDGVPEVVGEGGEGAGVGAAVVQQEQVEVAAWGELAAAVAADGDQGGAGQAGGGGVPGQQAGQPVVGEPGEGGAAVGSGGGLVLEEPQPGRG